MTTDTRPDGLTGRLIEAAIALLPVEHQARYREEWAGELAQLPTGEHAGFAARSLLHAPSLRRELRQADIAAGRRVAVPVLCRFHLHHWRTVHPNPEDQRIVSRQCSRCGSYQDGTLFTPLDPESMAMVTASRPPNGAF
ncbi:MAG: hypothetical protein U0Q21_09505 [Dermatophilaceae bacterium]